MSPAATRPASYHGDEHGEEHEMEHISVGAPEPRSLSSAANTGHATAARQAPATSRTEGTEEAQRTTGPTIMVMGMTARTNPVRCSSFPS